MPIKLMNIFHICAMFVSDFEALSESHNRRALEPAADGECGR